MAVSQYCAAEQVFWQVVRSWQVFTPPCTVSLQTDRESQSALDIQGTAVIVLADNLYYCTILLCARQMLSSEQYSRSAQGLADRQVEAGWQVRGPLMYSSLQVVRAVGRWQSDTTAQSTKQTR